MFKPKLSFSSKWVRIIQNMIQNKFFIFRHIKIQNVLRGIIQHVSSCVFHFRRALGNNKPYHLKAFLMSESYWLSLLSIGPPRLKKIKYNPSRSALPPSTTSITFSARSSCREILLFSDTMPSPLPNKRIEPEKRLAAFVKRAVYSLSYRCLPFLRRFYTNFLRQHRSGFINTLRLNKKANKSSQYQ